MAEFTQEQYQEFFDEFEKAYKEYENKVKERRARGIHDYNVFDVLETKEVKHSKFIASLLDPKGLHYQGDLFLREFINACGISDFGLDTSNVLVYREYKNIDIYITDGNKHIIIENKLWTGDHNEQVARYIQTIIDEQNKDELSEIYKRILVLYLTPFDYVIEKLGGIDEVGKDYLKLRQNQVAFRHISYENKILNWLNEVKIEIVNLTDLNVIITQYEKAVKNLINGGKMENNLIIEQIKRNYELCVNIHNKFENAKINLLNELFSKVDKTLQETINPKDWTIEFHEIKEPFKIFSIKLKGYNEENHDGNYIYYCIEPQNGYNNISFGLVRSNKVKNELNNDCFQDIVKESNYCKSWNKSKWWACYYKKFSTADDLILEYLKNEKFISEIVKDICDDLKNLKDVLEKLNKKLIEQLNKNL
ncbi:PD-(D/E)XK nuclease family protein [Campylobacter devanensis]|uniref:PDDEXK-like family protein n=1 Tax=Campylobacter devanensis TaxID=3161138 RepID=UPI000A343D56|nr:PD-(D/E)XK nuclease family protein [Campylobacter sp. P090]